MLLVQTDFNKLVGGRDDQMTSVCQREQKITIGTVMHL